MTAFYIIVIALLALVLAVVLKGNHNLMDDNKRKDTEIRTLRTRIRNIEHGR